MKNSIYTIEPNLNKKLEEKAIKEIFKSLSLACII